MAIDPSFLKMMALFNQQGPPGQQQRQPGQPGSATDAAFTLAPQPPPEQPAAVVAQRQQQAGLGAAGGPSYPQVPAISGPPPYQQTATPNYYSSSIARFFGDQPQTAAGLPDRQEDLGPPGGYAAAASNRPSLTIANGPNTGVAAVNPDGSIAPQQVAAANDQAGHIDLTGRPRGGPTTLPVPGAPNGIAAMGPIQKPQMPDFSPQSLMQAADRMYGNWRQLGASSAPVDPLAGARAGLTEQYQQQLAQYNQEAGNQTELQKAQIAANAHIQAAQIAAGTQRLTNSAPYQLARGAAAEAVKAGIKPQDMDGYIRARISATFPNATPEDLGEFSHLAPKASQAVAPGGMAGPGVVGGGTAVQSPTGPTTPVTQQPGIGDKFADLPRQLAEQLLGQPGQPAGATNASPQALIQLLQSNAKDLGPQGVSALMAKAAEGWPGGPQKFEADLLGYAADQARVTGAGQFKNMKFNEGGPFGRSSISIGGLQRQLPYSPTARGMGAISAFTKSPQEMQDKAQQLSILLDAINLHRGEATLGTAAAPTMFAPQTIQGIPNAQWSLPRLFGEW